MRTLLAIAFASSMLVIGCAPSASTCVAGMSVPCACSDGRAGAQTCRFSAYGPCVCDGVDTGAIDAAGPGHDGGALDDASTEEMDAFSPGVDAFTPPVDAAPGIDGGPPTIDLASAIVLNSPPDIATWDETAHITLFDIGPDGVHVEFPQRDGVGSWPDVPFKTPGEDVEYTLWIALNIDGQWYTSGCITFYRGLDRSGGPPSQYAMNWYYDAIRWAPMTGHQPAVGEWVGFFVTAGRARNITDRSGSTVYERSNVVVIPFPDDTGAIYTY
jgi:hypothetical protein